MQMSCSLDSVQSQESLIYASSIGKNVPAQFFNQNHKEDSKLEMDSENSRVSHPVTNDRIVSTNLNIKSWDELLKH